MVDFGTIQNSGSAITSAANSIVISFLVVIIDNKQTSGVSMWITAGAEYYSGNEIWIGQTALPFLADTVEFSREIILLNNY